MVCLIAGYGLHNGTSSSRRKEITRQKHDTVQISLVVKWPGDQCTKELGDRGYDGYDDEKEMCFGWKDTDTCEGDSGGPLLGMTKTTFLIKNQSVVRKYTTEL